MVIDKEIHKEILTSLLKTPHATIALALVDDVYELKRAVENAEILAEKTNDK